MWGSGLRVYGSQFKVHNRECRVKGIRFSSEVLGLAIRIERAELKVIRSNQSGLGLGSIYLGFRGCHKDHLMQMVGK